MKHPMEIVLKCALITMAPSHAPVMKDLFWQLITWDVMVNNIISKSKSVIDGTRAYTFTIHDHMQWFRCLLF